MCIGYKRVSVMCVMGVSVAVSFHRFIKFNHIHLSTLPAMSVLVVHCCVLYIVHQRYLSSKLNCAPTQASNAELIILHYCDKQWDFHVTFDPIKPPEGQKDLT